MDISTRVKDAVKSISNMHRPGGDRDIFLFATARGGSTWVMEVFASQPGMKYYDEPFNLRRHNVARTGLFPSLDVLMPDTGDPDRIVGFLRDLQVGRFGYMNPPPFRRNHRFFTNRIVFKIHGVEHLIGAIAAACHGQVVFLLRHPIPTTQSRTHFPRLDLFLRSRYYENLMGDPRVVNEARALAAKGSHLQRGLVSWCYENLVPLRFADFDGLFLTYEELLLNPLRSCDLLMERLHLSDRPALLRAFDQPAANISMSSDDTLALMADQDDRRRRAKLVTKWKLKTSAQEEAQATEVLRLFGLDAYDGSQPLAALRLLHFGDTAERIAGFAHDSDRP